MHLECYHTSRTVAKGHTCLFDLQEKSTGIRQLAVFLIGVKHCLRDKQNFKEIIWNKTPKRNSSHNWTVKKTLENKLCVEFKCFFVSETQYDG